MAFNNSIQPDIVVSLGAGTEKDCTSPRAPNFRHVFRDGFIPRLYRSFLSSLDGEGTWRELMNRLDERSRRDYFRLNISFSDQELAIDDIDCMNDLRASVHLRPRMFQDNKSIASALLTFTFFFELITIPLFDSRMFYCQGIIRCRLQGNVIVQALAHLNAQRQKHPPRPSAVCNSNGYVAPGPTISEYVFKILATPLVFRNPSWYPRRFPQKW